VRSTEAGFENDYPTAAGKDILRPRVQNFETIQFTVGEIGK
jgi:hypothetical protein